MDDSPPARVGFRNVQCAINIYRHRVGVPGRRYEMPRAVLHATANGFPDGEGPMDRAGITAVHRRPVRAIAPARKDWICAVTERTELARPRGGRHSPSSTPHAWRCERR